jgi:hypothetical protein
MSSYYVNTVAQSNGDHEVHVERCNFLPSPANRQYLGEFVSCAGAVAKARQSFRQVNGCFYCSRACHTQ